MVDVTPELLLSAYEAGIFPMAESADDPSLYWVEPERRGILPLDAFHVPRRLKRTVRLREFEIRVDSNFDGVILGCAASAPGRRKTWINGRIRELYGALFRMGKCHTVECWCDGSLVGGLYGVKIGRAFFGESMFSKTRDASKVALIHLAGRLRAGGFVLLDTQFVTDHLSQFGAMEVNRREYRKLLANALSGDGNFYPWPEADSPSLVLQSISQTS